MKEIKCSNASCNWNVLVKSADGNWRFTTRALKTQGPGKPLVGVCRRCGSETELPYGLMEIELEKSDRPREPRRRGFTVIHRPSSNSSDKEGT